MSNWAAYKESEIGLPVFKRAKHGIHFDKGNGEVLAEFVGKPCHYLDGKEYKPIDTRPLLRKDGSYGCPHSDVVILSDGTVQVGTYAQKAALIYPKTIKVDGDRLVREFTGGRQYLYITEDGYRQEIVLEKMPDLRKISALVDSVKGILPTKYTSSSLSLRDSSTAELSDFVQVDKTSLASVLEAAKYPVVIDPDFAGSTADLTIYGDNADFATARATSSGTLTSTSLNVGAQLTTNWRLFRSFVVFDTSSIDDDATITQNNLTLTAYDKDSKLDFTIQIAKYLATGTRETDYDGCLTSDQDSSSWWTNSGTVKNQPHTSGNLSTAWINKTGNTGYGLIASIDRSDTPPWEGSGYAISYICSASYATESYRPVLTVTYAAAGTFIPVNMMANTQNLTAGMRG